MECGHGVGRHERTQTIKPEQRCSLPGSAAYGDRDAYLMGSLRMISTRERVRSVPVAVGPHDISVEHKGSEHAANRNG